MEPSSVDRISSLPNDIREQILMSLPLRDAAKCSILSTKWRYLWNYLPTLVICQRFGEAIVARERRSKDYRIDVVERLIMLDVCKVLMLHRGPLKDFSLCLAHLGDQVDQVLYFLPYSTLQSLTIVSFCTLSKAAFTSFSQLKTLSLTFCTFIFSDVSFDGFDRLTLLELRYVDFSGFENQLCFRCPLLTTLTLERCFSCSPYCLVEVEEAPLLECLFLVGFDRGIVLLREVVGTVETLFIGIGNIHEYMNMTSRRPWVKLRQLSLAEVEGHCLNTRSNVLAVVRMIMNSPNLQRLEILTKDVYVDFRDHAVSDEVDDEGFGDKADEVGITDENGDEGSIIRMKDVYADYRDLAVSDEDDDEGIDDEAGGITDEGSVIRMKDVYADSRDLAVSDEDDDEGIDDEAGGITDEGSVIRMKDSYVYDSDYVDSGEDDDSYPDEDDDEDPDDEAVGITELRDVASEYEQLRLLKMVEVSGIRGTKNEMTLISWLLNFSPALDQMKIEISPALSKDELLRVVIQLKELERASSKTRVIICSNHHFKV
ncbi:F-box/FBD/LRR-repeat protein At1g13570 [Linum grandiflorum]